LIEGARGSFERVSRTGATLAIEFIGDLAGILALAAGSKKPASAKGDGLQVALVAGEGFEPSTFRL